MSLAPWLAAVGTFALAPSFVTQESVALEAVRSAVDARAAQMLGSEESFAIELASDGHFRAALVTAGATAELRPGIVEITAVDGDPREFTVNGTHANHAPWRVALETRGIRRGGASAAPHASKLANVRSTTANGDRLEFDRGDVVEWFVLDARGLEQGWTLRTPPAGDPSTPLEIEIGVEGLGVVVASAEDSLTFVDAAQHRCLACTGLAAWDANGRTLAARLVARPYGFGIEVDDHGASYPVTVDPLLGAPDWTIVGGALVASLGAAVAGAGDVDGDGFDDVLVGVPENPFGGEWGEARLYRGALAGPSTTVAWTYAGTNVLDYVGRTVAGAGDVDADGFDDVLVGGRVAALGTSRVNLFLGSSSGPSTTPVWSNGGPSPYQGIGRTAAPAGDVNGDGFADVLLTDGNFSLGEFNEGGAAVYHGSATGLGQVPAWSTEGQQSGAFFGRSAASAGDVDGDGYDDVIVGASEFDGAFTDEGRAYLYLGSPSGLDETPAWTVSGEHAAQYFGHAVAGLGDVDGDGYDDVAVSTPYANGPPSQIGKLWIFRGSPSGPSTTATWIASGATAFDQLGELLARVGDFDADGFDDVLTMATPQPGAPELRVYRGSANGPIWADPFTAPVPNLLNQVVAGAGNVDGDGAADVLFGNPEHAVAFASMGEARLYRGVCGPLVLQQPSATTVCAGTSTTFAVVAYGASSHQWRKDGVPLSDGGAYQGVTTTQLSIIGASAAEAGDYDCVLSNTCGNTISSAASLVVDTLDSDLDGTPDCADGCPTDPQKIAPGSCGCGAPETDSDGDAVADCVDNCAAIANPGQEDCNANDVGDVCDLADATSLDVDGNSIPDECEAGFATPYCFGDGSGTPCPCDNYGAGGAGCGNSVGGGFQGGALLYNFGGASVGAGDTALYCVHLPKNKFGLVYFGSKSFPTGGLGTPFGDGLRCLGGTLQRFGAHSTGASGSLVELDPAAQFPTMIVAGSTWHFQAWYRDPSGPCGGGFNLSNALRITFAP